MDLGLGSGLNVISRFRFGAPPTFRAHRHSRSEYSTCGDSFVLYTAAGEIATKHMLPAVHSIYLATSSAVMRDGEIRDAEGPRKPFVSSCFDRRSGAAIDIPKCILIYVSHGSCTYNIIYEMTCDRFFDEFEIEFKILSKLLSYQTFLCYKRD